MYRRILVPVSDSAVSEGGVREAVRLAHGGCAVLRFIHVVDAGGTGLVGCSGIVDADLHRRDWRVVAPVEAARRQAVAAGLECDVVLRDGVGGSACELVALEARAWGADVIVLGATAVPGAGLRPGSVGSRILQSSPVPVLAVSPRIDHR